jgi:1-acyl-sn-glycerol-3-phosphate acyltransferase
VSHSQFALLRERRFLPFFVTQGLGAFNDNVYRAVLVILATYQASTWTSLDPALVTNLAGGLFILPFLLFSGLAGQLADRYDKVAVMRTVKVAEIGIMTIAGTGLAITSLPVLLAAIFLLGMHSTFFAPAKYAYLPQVLRESELIGGNALLEAATFLMILLGMLVGGLLVVDGGSQRAIVLLLLVAVLGWLASRQIPPLGATDPGLAIDRNLWRSSWENLRAARTRHSVFQALLGNSWFWFMGAALTAQLPLYVRNVAHGDETVFTLFLMTFSVGVGVGSLLCDRLSSGQIEIGLVPLGSIGLTLFGLLFATHGIDAPPGTALAAREFLAAPGAIALLLYLGLFGLSGGLFAVPLYAMIQQRTAPAMLSRVLSANNILNALFMVAAAAFSAFALWLGLTIPQLLVVIAIMNAVVAAYIYAQLPEFLLRLLAWILIRGIYRLRVQGIENIPAKGPALLICNHVSFVDPIAVSAACRRPIRFIMDHGIFRIPVMSLVFRGMKAIPVAPEREQPEVYERAFNTAAAELRAGHLVCIFPEGGLTGDGELRSFRAGMMRILRETPVPVVPMALSGLWGSMFSRAFKPLWQRLPRRLFAQVRLNVGTPIVAVDAELEGMRQRVLELRGERR